MQLSEHDLKQLDEETIRSLQAGALCTLSLKLLADLKEARDRLNQSPDNSSRPPSSRAPWEGADTEPQDDGEAEGAEPQEAGRAVEPVVTEQIEETVRQAELVYADETGWKEHAKHLWLWVFTCTTASLFAVGKRTREVVVRVLGEQFDHWLMSDGYGVYRQYDWRLRCLAHLIRNKTIKDTHITDAGLPLYYA